MLGPGRGAPFVVPALGILAVAPLLVGRCGRWRNGDDNRLEAEAAAREIAAATGLSAQRRGYRVTERAGPAGSAREVRQEAGTTTPLD